MNLLSPTRLRTFVTLGLLMLLMACETTPIKQETTGWDDPLWQRHHQSLTSIQSFHIKGRIGITLPDDSFSSSYQWSQKAKNTYNFRMYGAFGQTYALLDVTPDYAELETGDDQFFESDQAEELLHRVLGWSLPMDYLQDWIKGLPTGIRDNQLTINKDGTLQQLEFEDYQVQFVSYKTFPHPIESRNIAMPRKIKITQQGKKVILTIRSWDMNYGL